MQQLGNIDFVESQVRRIAAEVDGVGVPVKSVSSSSTAPPTARYHIAQDIKKPLILGEWLANHSDDPALKVPELFALCTVFRSYSHKATGLSPPPQTTPPCTPTRVRPVVQSRQL